MSESVGSLSHIIPWAFMSEYHEGVVVQKNGLLQRTFAYRAGDADSQGAEEISRLCLRMNDVTMRLSTGWAVFIEAQRFCTRDYPQSGVPPAFDTLASYLIERERETSFTAFGRHFESSYYLTFVWQPPVESAKKLASLFIQSAKARGKGSRTMRENVQFFVNETDSFVGLLAQDMRIQALSGRETIQFLHSQISLRKHEIRFPHCKLRLDRVLPDSELETSLTMRLGGYYIPIVGVNDFPDATYPLILEGLNRRKLEYRWVTRYICLSKEDGLKETRKKEKSHRGNRVPLLKSIADNLSNDGNSGSHAVNHGAGLKEDDSIDAGTEIDDDKASLGYYTSCVMVWDRDYDAAKRKAEIVRIAVNSMGFTAKEETYGNVEVFKGMMAGQVYANLRALPVMSYNFSHALPLSSVWAGLRHNEHAGRVSGVDVPHVTCSTIEGTPFYLNLNPGGDVGHTAIWGPTGAGKSTLLNLLEVQFYRYPESQVIVFDKGRSCRQICLALGGLFFEPASENSSGVAFQPLRDLESDRDLADAMDFIESLFTVNGNAVSPQMRTEIRRCLDSLKGIPVQDRTLTTFAQSCQYLDPIEKRNLINEQLADYLLTGKYGRIFDSAFSSLSLDTRFLAIEMEELMNRGDNCVVPALIYLFNLVEKKFDFGGRLSLLVLDEAWLFLRNEIFSEKIAEWLKVLRKKNVFVVFATQDVADVAKSPLKTTIAQQCLTKIFLADNSAVSNVDMRYVYGNFGLSDTEIDYIAHSTMKRDYYYTSHLGRRMFQLDIDRVTMALIGAPQHDLLDALVAEKGPGVPLCRDILAAYGIDYGHLMRGDAPEEKIPESLPEAERIPPPVFVPPASAVIKEASPASSSSPAPRVDAASLLDAVAAIEKRSGKGEGRAADLLARRLGVSRAAVYWARKVLRHGSAELIEQVRNGEVTLKKAWKSLAMAEAG